MKEIYKHIRNKHGGVTVCCRRTDSLYTIGVAFCSPKEKNFNKKIGRMIASNREEVFREHAKGFRSIQGTAGMVPASSEHELKSIAVVDRLLPMIAGPTWFEKFLKEYFNNKPKL